MTRSAGWRGLVALALGVGVAELAATAWLHRPRPPPVDEVLPPPFLPRTVAGDYWPARVGVAGGARLQRGPHPRVLALGDSFIYGLGVGEGEDVPTRVAEALAAADNPVDMVNLGRIGMDLERVARLYHRVGRLYGPDVVLWFFVLNDLGDPLPPAVMGGAYHDLINDSVGPGRVAGSALLGLVARARAVAALSAASEAGYRALLTDPARLARAERLLREVVEDRVGSGGRVVVAIYPLLHRLRAYPFREAHEAVAAMAERAGAEVVDLLPAFEGRDARALWVSRADHHPNPAAHALAGAWLALHLGAVVHAPALPCPPRADAFDPEGRLQAVGLCADPTDPARWVAWLDALDACAACLAGPDIEGTALRSLGAALALELPGATAAQTVRLEGVAGAFIPDLPRGLPASAWRDASRGEGQ